MQSVIGNTLVRNLRSTEKPYEVRDMRLKGLLLRVQPSGVMSYYVEYGRGKRIAIGRAGVITPAQARERAKEVLADAYKGGDPMVARRETRAHTFRSFIDEVYGPWARSNLRTAEATMARLKRSFPDLQEVRLGDITPWQIEKWRMARRKSGVKPATVNRDLDDLKSSLGKAVIWDLLESNPITSVRRSKVDGNPAVRFLTEEEEAGLRAALDARESRRRDQRARANRWRADRRYRLQPDLGAQAYADRLKPLVLLSLNTGLRRGELFSLVWPDLDLDQAILTVQGTKAKSGRTRHVPLNAEALAVLEGWRQISAEDAADGLVFPGRNGKQLNNIRRSWAAVLESAGIERFRWHDLRHTFASRLVMRGVNLNTVRELLGHADYQMTLRYVHLAPEHRAAAVARLIDPSYQTTDASNGAAIAEA